MKPKEFIQNMDVLSFEQSLFDIPARKEYILKSIGKGKRVLDLGCMGGQVSKLIKDQNNEVHGIELNADAAEKAKKLGIKVKVFDLNDGIPFEDQFFDVVNAGQVLQKVYDTKFLFEESNRVLRPNGFFIFSVLNLNSFENRVRVFKGDFLSKTGAYAEDQFGENIRLFNVPKIKELCRSNGFQIVDLTGLNHFGLVSRLHEIGRVPLLQNLAAKVTAPVGKVLPQFAEILLIKARRLDQ